MTLSPVTERRIVTFLPPLLIAALLIPFAMRQNAWYEWENAYWFLQRQTEHVSAHGVPTLFLHTKDGSFYPFFLYYGGFTIGLLAYPAALFGVWPVFLASMVAAVVGGYLGIWWTALSLGLSRRLAVLPALIYATTPYVLSDAYGRGAWAELVGVNAVAVMLGGWAALLRSDARYPKLALAALVGSGAVLAGTHNVTLLMTAAVLPLIVLALLPFTSGGRERAAVLAPLGRGAIAAVLGVGLTAAWLVPNLWLGPKTFISQVTLSQEGFVATAPFVRITNVLSPWPVVPSEFKGVMWIYAQGPVPAIVWVLVALAVTLVAARRGGGVSRGVVASSVALVVLGIALLELITHPVWWPSLPRLVQTVQMPMRLLPFLAIITALAVSVLVVGIGQRRERGPLTAGLVVAVAAQALVAIFVVTSGEPGVTLTATPVRHGEVKVDGEPSPFSGPGEIVPSQFRVLDKPQGDQTVVAKVAAELDSRLTSDAGTLQGRADVGDRIATDIVASPLVRIVGDVKVAGRTDKGLTLLEVTRTDADGVFTGTVQAQCALCLSTAGSGWQLRIGRLITLLSVALLLMAGVASVRGAQQERRRRRSVASQEPRASAAVDEQLPVGR
jgi:hypothetical protein